MCIKRLNSQRCINYAYSSLYRPGYGLSLFPRDVNLQHYMYPQRNVVVIIVNTDIRAFNRYHATVVNSFIYGYQQVASRWCLIMIT